MSNNRHGDGRNRGGVAVQAICLEDGRRAVEVLPEGAAGRTALRVRSIERTALVRFVDAEILFEEEAVHMVGRELRRLIEGQRPSRLVVNFAGVRYISSEVLGILASLQKEVDPARGSIVLCGLDPLLRDMVRITHLERVFDVCGDEAEALDLILC
jgi:anti-anti-sigma factor